MNRRDHADWYFVTACVGKRQFTSSKAHILAAHMSAKYKDRLQAYLCPFCGTWHVGHPKERDGKPQAVEKRGPDDE